MATYVLVHGAWGGGGNWRLMQRRLQEIGHDVFTPTLTGLGDRAHLASPAIDLSTHIQDVASVIDYEGLDDIILAGHSYGGMVVTGLAGRLGSKIRKLIYVDAFLPEDGDALWDIADDDARRHYIEAQKGHPGLVAPLSVVAERGEGPPPALHPLLTLTEPVRLDGEEQKIEGRTYVYATRGAPTIFTKFYERVRADPDWNTHEVDSGHMVMYDAADALFSILKSEAES